VAAVDSQAADVELVAEGNRLVPGNAGLRDVGRAVQGVDQPEQAGKQEGGAEERGSSDGVGARMEDLSHRRVSASAHSPQRACPPWPLSYYSNCAPRAGADDRGRRGVAVSEVFRNRDESQPSQDLGARQLVRISISGGRVLAPQVQQHNVSALFDGAETRVSD